MISFNDLKNNIEIMKNCLKDMKFFDQKDKNIKANFIQEEVLRKNFPQLFLQILHYVLIEFSYDFFTEVLQQCPTIRTDNDMPFIQHTILISRSLLKIDVKIDANQFFNQNKFFQKKVELISKICKGVYEFQMSGTKVHATNVIPNINKSKNLNKIQQNKNPKIIKSYIEQEEDQDMPRNITVAPTKIQPSINITSFNSHFNQNKFQNYDNNLNNNNSDSDQQLRLLRQRKNKIQNQNQNQNLSQKPKQKQKQLPTNIIIDNKKTVSRLNRNMQLTKQKQQPQKIKHQHQNKQQTQKVYFNAEKNIKNKNIKKQEPHSDDEQQQQQQLQQSEEYMTRKQVLQIMSLLNTNISKLITNFNDFQKDVGTWMNNINAKVSLLQQNVKTIRNNL